MTAKGQIFRGYAEQIIAHHEFGTAKMVDLSPDYFCREAGTEECFRLLKELIAEGWLKEYHTSRTVSHGSRGFKVYSTIYSRWIGLTSKGWAIANRYLNAK